MPQDKGCRWQCSTAWPVQAACSTLCWQHWVWGSGERATQPSATLRSQPHQALLAASQQACQVLSLHTLQLLKQHAQHSMGACRYPVNTVRAAQDTPLNPLPHCAHNPPTSTANIPQTACPLCQSQPLHFCCCQILPGLCYQPPSAPRCAHAESLELL